MWQEFCIHTKHVQPLGYTQYHAPSSPSTGGVKVEDGKLKVYDAGAPPSTKKFSYTLELFTLHALHK